MGSYTADHPPVPVRSCFGALAVYRFELFVGCPYLTTGDALRRMPAVRGYVAHDGVLCEHIPMHFCMRDLHNATIGLMMPY